MSKVQIDDFDCENCGKTTIAELDIKRCEYTCLNCVKAENLICEHCKKHNNFTRFESYTETNICDGCLIKVKEKDDN